jgi:type IV secretory pathway TraG/TraD family ATPase VirD4
MEKFSIVDYLDIITNYMSRFGKHLVIPTWLGIVGGILFTIMVTTLLPSSLFSLSDFEGAAKAFLTSGNGNGFIFVENVDYEIKYAQKYFGEKVEHNLTLMIGSFFSSAILCGLATFSVITKIAQKHSEKMLEDQFLKGSQVIPEDKALEILPTLTEVDGTPVGHKGILFPVEYHCQHVFVSGGSGTGKTIFLTRSYIDIKKENPNARFIVHDTKGDWTQKHYDPTTDFIFNFSDTRSVNYNIFSSIKTINDLKAIVSTIIPRSESDKSDPIWIDSARGILEACLLYCMKYDKKQNIEVKKLIEMNPALLAKHLEGVQGAEIGRSYLIASETQVSNFMSNFRSKCLFFTSLTKGSGEDLRIEEWLEGKGNSTIFLLNDTKNKDLNAIRIAVFVDAIVKAHLSLNESNERKIYYFLDEMGSLNKISSIISGLTLGRSFGASFWIGIQEVARLNAIYGKDLTSTIVNNTGTKVILRGQDVETQKFCSDMIGDTKFKTTSISNSTGAETGSAKEGSSFNQTEKTEKLILPSEIGLMPNNAYYYKTVNHNWIYIETRYIESVDYREIVNPSFIEREDLNIEFMFNEEMAEDEGEGSGEENVSLQIDGNVLSQSNEVQW